MDYSPWNAMFLGLVILVVSLILALWIWAIIDLFRRRDLSTGQTVLWFLILIAFHILGALVYRYLSRPRHSGSTTQ